MAVHAVNFPIAPLYLNFVTARGEWFLSHHQTFAEAMKEAQRIKRLHGMQRYRIYKPASQRISR